MYTSTAISKTLKEFLEHIAQTLQKSRHLHRKQMHLTHTFLFIPLSLRCLLTKKKHSENSHCLSSLRRTPSLLSMLPSLLPHSPSVVPHQISTPSINGMQTLLCFLNPTSATSSKAPTLCTSSLPGSHQPNTSIPLLPYYC